MSAPRTCAECKQDWGGFYGGLKGWRCPACRNVPEDLWIRRTRWYEGNEMYPSLDGREEWT